MSFASEKAASMSFWPTVTRDFLVVATAPEAR